VTARLSSATGSLRLAEGEEMVVSHPAHLLPEYPGVTVKRYAIGNSRQVVVAEGIQLPVRVLDASLGDRSALATV